MEEVWTGRARNEGYTWERWRWFVWGWFPSERFLISSSFWLKVLVVVPVKEGTARQVKKYSTISPSVLKPSSLGVPVLSPKPW
jgi:hypothetical protein